MQLVLVEVEVVKESDNAWLVTATGEPRDAVWVPRSKAEIIRQRGKLPQISLPEWMAIENGLV